MNFVLAVVKNDLNKARSLLQSGVDVNSAVPWNAQNSRSPVITSEIASQPDLLEKIQNTQEYYSRPLNLAVLGGHADMVRLLLSAGADVNAKDGRGRTPIICAIYGLDLDISNINTSNLQLISGTHEHHYEIMKNILLRHPNLYSSTLDSPQYEIKGITPLCLASYLGKTDIIQLLLDDGRVNVNGTDSKNATAIMYAARDGNVPIVKTLLAYNASSDLTDNHGWSTIQYAERSPEIVQLCEESLRNRRPDSTLTLTPENGANFPINYSKLSNMIASLPEFPSSLAHVEFDTLKDVDHLDPNAYPLVEIIQTAFVQAIKTHDHQSLRTMLLWSPSLHKGDRPLSGPLLVNYHDPKTGLTPLHHAIRSRPFPSLYTIMMLYYAGADINAQTYYGRTALHHLARFGVDKEGRSWGIQKSARQMNERRDKTNIRRNDHSAVSPITSPTMDPMMGDMSPPLAPNSAAQFRLSMQSALSNKSSASDTVSVRGGTTDINNSTAKHILGSSTVQQHLALCASLLLRMGALVNIADPTGNTPLHFAAEFGGVPEVLEVLILEGNADLEVRNKKNLTPLDVCKTDDVRKKMLAIEQERRLNPKTESMVSYASGGNIRAFDVNADDSASVDHLTRSRVTSQQGGENSKWWDRKDGRMPSSASEANAPKTKKSEEQSMVDADFQRILEAFFTYQTTFTDSIETDLAQITDTILGLWAMSNEDHRVSIEQLKKTIAKLRMQLRKAQEMFDTTHQRTEHVMIHYQDELEQVEQIHQADWEMSDLQVDKLEKLTDVFQRIDGRFNMLDNDQEQAMRQMELLRKCVLRHIDQLNEDAYLEDMTTEVALSLANLSQTLTILDTLPCDPELRPRQDWQLYKDISAAIDLVAFHANNQDEETMATLKSLRSQWEDLQVKLTKPPALEVDDSVTTDESSPSEESHPDVLPIPGHTPCWKKQLQTAKLYSKPPTGAQSNAKTLNQLELSFEILSENLNEIKKDIEIAQVQTDQVAQQKKKMYNVCLTLEAELTSRANGTSDSDDKTYRDSNKSMRSERSVRDELDHVMQSTQALFEEQLKLDKDRERLGKEHGELERQLDEVRQEIRRVRPTLLLQGLLERLDTDDYGPVRIERDWKEDNALVTEVFEPRQDEHGNNSDEEASIQARMRQVAERCQTMATARSLAIRLDASLFALKVIAAHTMSRCRQVLVSVQGSLSQARGELDDTRMRMTALYDDAVDVSQQVCTLKEELHVIISNRIDEVVKVWEVVDEVSNEIGTNLTLPPHGRDKSGNSQLADKQQQRIEEQDRHQWILRELDQLKIVHDDLQATIEELKEDQIGIGQHLRQFAAALLDPQVHILVGQEDVSLLSTSDRLAMLLDRIRHDDIGVTLMEDVKTSPSTPVTPTSKPSTFEENGSQTSSGSTVVANSSGVATAGTSQTARRIGPPAHRVSLASLRSTPQARSMGAAAAAATAGGDRHRMSIAVSVRTDKKRMSILSLSSFSSINSYQQERMLSNALSIRQALHRVQRPAGAGSSSTVNASGASDAYRR